MLGLLLALSLAGVSSVSAGQGRERGPCGETVDMSPPPPGWERVRTIRSETTVNRAGDQQCQWKVDTVEYREARNGHVSFHRRLEYTLIGTVSRTVTAEHEEISPNPPSPSARLAQTALDFVRGAIDDLTFGLTAELRRRLYRNAAQIIDEQSADVGKNASFVAQMVVPVPGPGKVKLAFTLGEFAESTRITAAAAKAVRTMAQEVWQMAPTLRGKVIENVLAVLEYRPKGFDWIGVADKGRFRQIDFINVAERTLVSLKTVLRSTDAGWVSSVNTLKRHLTDLADVDKQWRFYGPNSAPARTVLDVRVPPGFESRMNELVAFGKSLGIEVRIGAF